MLQLKQSLLRLRYIPGVRDVFYLRPITPPVTPEAVVRLANEAGGCFDLHRVVWTCSFLATDGGRMLCWYRAPDAESARLALKELGSDMNAVWPGTVVGQLRADEPEMPQIDALAEISFSEPLPRGSEEVLQRLAHNSLHDVPVAAGFLSSDRRRMVALLQAPDASAAGAALASAALAVESVWPCTLIAPPRPV